MKNLIETFDKAKKAIEAELDYINKIGVDSYLAETGINKEDTAKAVVLDFVEDIL